MDEREGRDDIIGLLRQAAEIAQPDLRAYYRMVRKAKVVAAYASDGQYYCDVQPLKNDETVDEREPVVPQVAIPVIWGGPNRGIVCPPEAGTLCDLSYYDGDPNYPFISNLRWGMGQDAPKADLKELVIQLEEGVEIRIDREKNVVTLTPENWTVKVGKNASIEAAEAITIKAPQIFREGNVVARGEEGGKASITENADKTQNGNLVINGDLTVSGQIFGKVAGCSGC